MGGIPEDLRVGALELFLILTTVKSFYCHWVEIFNLKMCFGIQAFVRDSIKGIKSCISIVIAGRSEAGMREAARLHIPLLFFVPSRSPQLHSRSVDRVYLLLR